MQLFHDDIRPLLWYIKSFPRWVIPAEEQRRKLNYFTTQHSLFLYAHNERKWNRNRRHKNINKFRESLNNFVARCRRLELLHIFRCFGHVKATFAAISFYSLHFDSGTELLAITSPPPSPWAVIIFPSFSSPSPNRTKRAKELFLPAEARIHCAI